MLVPIVSVLTNGTFNLWCYSSRVKWQSLMIVFQQEVYSDVVGHCKKQKHFKNTDYSLLNSMQKWASHSNIEQKYFQKVVKYNCKKLT